jgi:hypothetical protein
MGHTYFRPAQNTPNRSEGMSEGISSAPSAAKLLGSHDEVERKLLPSSTPSSPASHGVEPSKSLMDSADVG